ncbi:hypothetical protein [Amedibacterium intestinale]|uniref:hypothetical protein n=1 Tax=Amedibacterium intestinale TaxID=2583452 RepID=UPI000E20609B
MKNIPEERLSTIGKLIEVTREEKRNKSQNKYTMKSFVEGICTVNTLKRIEAGEIARIEDVYVELLDKLNLKLGYFPAVDDAILELMDPLYEAIEYYRVEDISKYCDMGLRVLGKVKNYVYYSELYDLLMATKEYFEEAKIISLSKMERFRNEYTLFDEKYHSLFKIMVFYRGQAEAHNDPKLFETIVEEFQLLSSSSVMENILGLNYCIIFKKYITFREKVNALENELEYRKNYVRLLDVYVYKIFGSINIENQVDKEYLVKADNLIALHQFPNIKVMDFYSNIAAALHEIKLYKEALLYYEKMVEVTEIEKLWLPALNCMAHCQRMLGMDINIPKLDDKHIARNSILDQKAYKYFITKNVETFAKINFILKEIAPFLMYESLIKVFSDEMEFLLKETGSYKNLYLFNMIIQENKKKWNDDFIRNSK